MSKIIPFFCLWAFVFFAPFYTYAQELKFGYLVVNDGLSTDHINCFLQDKDGFLWVGTEDGLNKYNGYQFTIYRYQVQNLSSISSNSITVLYEDRKQNIWIGTRKGLNRYDKDKNRFVRYETTNNLAMLTFISEDSKGNLWVGGYDFFGKLDTETGKFSPIDLTNFKKQVGSTKFYKIIKANENEFWFGVLKNGLHKLDLRTNKITSYWHEDKNSNSLASNNVETIHIDKKGIVWIGMRDGGLDRLDTENQTFTHCLPEVSTVVNITEIDNNLWLCLENKGITIFDKQSNKLKNYQYNKDIPKSLNDNASRVIYQDYQQRIWVGTRFGGINYIDKQKEKFSSIDVSLKRPVVNAVILDSKKRLWIGSEGGLTKVENEQTTHYEHDPKQKGSLQANPVLSIYEDRQQRIWIGTWEGGLHLFDDKTASFINFTKNADNPNSLLTSNVFALRQSTENGALLLGTSGGEGFVGGLSIMSTPPRDFFINYENNSLVGIAIYEDSKHNIWVGTPAMGLSKFDLKTGKTIAYAHDVKNVHSLSNNTVNTILEDKKGRLWIGTNVGINMMKEDGKFIKYSSQNGLASDIILGILEDEKGNLWLTTNNGLSKFDPESKQIRNFFEADGLKSNQFKRNACFKTSDNLFILGTAKGLNIFHPDSIKYNANIPPVYITGFKIFNKSVQIDGEDNILKQDISQTKELTLTYEHAVFSLDFVALNFTQSAKNQYAYQMEGFDKDWNYVSNQRSATYTNLDAGTYIFRVKASNNDGVWNETGTSIKITILPPWWKTWWFRLLAISIFLSSGVALYLIRVDAIKKQNQRLEKTVVLRTKELQLANHEVEAKNSALQSTEEELRQNMEELETNQEELKIQKERLENAFQQLNRQNTKVNDSIRYAKRIQNAVLPHENILDIAFKEHFIIFKPKDVVSGDFYWYLEVEKKKFLAVVDCTGHGVPGAFMSMIGNTLLYEIINAKHTLEPHHILDQLHLGILNSLNNTDVKMQDGMDIALCCIESGTENKVKVQFSGAKRSLYYFSNEELIEIQADKKSIGQSSNSQIVYTLHEIELQAGDTLYMSTDGWVDAINAERKRFGSQKLKEMLLQGSHLPLKTQKNVFSHILADYEQGTEQRDDVLLVGVKV